MRTASRVLSIGLAFALPPLVGYGLDLNERWRNLPDLHLVGTQL